MKKILLIVFLLLLGINLSSQTCYKYEEAALSENDIRLYNNTIETDDKDVIVFEKYYKNNVFCGVEMLKFNQMAELLDSAIVDFTNISSYSRLIKNPFENDNYTLGGFYLNEEDGFYYYNAIFFNGNLEITNEIDVRIPYSDINLKHYRIYFNNKNEFLVWGSYKEYTDVVSYIRMDIYGKVLSYKQFDSDELEGMCITKNPFFVLNESPLRYGVVYYKVNSQNGEWIESDCSKLIAVLDEDLNTIDIRHIEQVENYKFRSTDNTHVVGLEEGGFIMASEAFVYYGTDVCITLTRFDKDFNIIDLYTTPHYNIGAYEVYVNNNLCIEKNDTGCVYLVWNLKNISNNVYSSYVYFLDDNLNLQWECLYDSSKYYPLFIYDICSLKNGGLVLVGRNILSISSCCYIIQNKGTVIYEHSNDIRSYSFYPNPTSDVLNIRYFPDVNAEKVEIYGMDGKLYHEQNFNMETINVNGLSTGIYMMKVVMENGETFTEKVVVK